MKTDLRKFLNRWDLLAITIGIVIGVGIFRVPAEVAQHLRSPGLILLAWLVGGLICLMGALCFAELSSTYPKAGGIYVYLRESFGAGIAFLFGWTELLVIRTGSIAAMAFVFSEYFQSFFSLQNFSVKWVAIFSIIILSALNVIGLTVSKIFQDFVTVAKCFALFVIMVFGFLSPQGNINHFQVEPVLESSVNIGAFVLALIPILWTFGGWHESTFVTEEAKDSQKALPFVLIIGTIFLAGCYLLLNAVYIYLIPVETISQSPLIGSDVMRILFGAYGQKFMEGVIILAALGAMNAMIITGSRVTYAMAKDNVLFRTIGKLDLRTGAPLRAIVINMVWGLVLVLWGSFGQLLFFTGIVVWLFFALTGLGLFRLRFLQSERERPFKAWGYPWTPAFFVVICGILFVNTLIGFPKESLIGLTLMLSGLPVFWWSKSMDLGALKGP